MTKCIQHHWVQHPKREGHYKCSSCSVKFPCRETDCGHQDCIDFRGATCYVCHKKIDGDEWFVNHLGKVQHPSCNKEEPNAAIQSHTT